jgi:hypothetical protein
MSWPQSRSLVVVFTGLWWSMSRMTKKWLSELAEDSNHFLVIRLIDHHNPVNTTTKDLDCGQDI